MMPRDSEERQNSKAEPEATGQEEVVESEDIETLNQALAEQKAKAETNLAGWQRSQADFENYKKRSEQEKEEISKFANSVLMLGLLPVLDDLERAFASVPPRLAKLSWVDGMKLIGRKLMTSLETQGLSPIEAVGKPFDPNFHEAAMQGKGEEGIVVQELQKGYMLRDRVIRPSMVIVGNGQPAGEEETGEEGKDEPESENNS